MQSLMIEAYPAAPTPQLFIFQQRKPHFFPLLYISHCSAPCKIPYSGNVTGSFGNTNGSPGIEKIEGMGTFQTAFISR
jgi:hypothetical protein